MFNKTHCLLKPLFSFLIILVVFTSCTEEFKPINFKISSINKSYDADISVTYDMATGNDELSKIINFKVEKAIISTLSIPEKKTNLEAVLDDFNAEFVSFKTTYPEDEEPVWELQIETELSYQSQDIITIAISTYEFKGGAHGSDKITFLNLNAITGDVLHQKDIITNLDEFKTVAETYFKQSLKVENAHLKMEDFFFGKPFQLPENIGFSADGLVLLYNVYEVASYAQGYTEFVIPFDEVQDYLKVN